MLGSIGIAFDVGRVISGTSMSSKQMVTIKNLVIVIPRTCVTKGCCTRIARWCWWYAYIIIRGATHAVTRIKTIEIWRKSRLWNKKGIIDYDQVLHLFKQFRILPDRILDSLIHSNWRKMKLNLSHRAYYPHLLLIKVVHPKSLRWVHLALYHWINCVGQLSLNCFLYLCYPIVH